MDAREAIKKQFLKEYEKGDFQSITVKVLSPRSWALAPDSSGEAWADEQMK